MKPQLAIQEIISLNVEDFDIQELERRLELSVITPLDGGGGGCSCHCTSNSCGCNCCTGNGSCCGSYCGSYCSSNGGGGGCPRLC